MKIIFITREGYTLPGARIRCYNFAKELCKYGIETEVFSFSDSLGAKDGAEESKMGLRDKITFNYRAFKKLINDKEAILFIQRLNYHSFAPYSAYLFNKNKIILDLDDWEMRENPKYYFRFYPSSKAYHLTREIARKSIFCIAASHYLKEFLLQFNRKVYLIPSGVDTELFKPSLNGLGEDEIVFSWVGTLHRKEYIENIELALDCFCVLRKKYAHIYCDIVGDGIYKESLMRLLKGFNDPHIRFKGWLAPGTISAYLDSVHIGLMPVARNTKFNLAKSPTKLFEYMAMAKPAIASRIGEAAQIISDGDNGFLAETKEDFIQRMQELIVNARLRQRMGERARQTVKEHYALDILGKRLYEYLNK